MITLYVTCAKDGLEMESSVDISPSATIKKLSLWVKSEMKYRSIGEFRMKWNGGRLDNNGNDSLASLGMQDGDEIYVAKAVKGGKFVQGS